MTREETYTSMSRTCKLYTERQHCIIQIIKSLKTWITYCTKCTSWHYALQGRFPFQICCGNVACALEKMYDVDISDQMVLKYLSKLNWIRQINKTLKENTQPPLSLWWIIYSYTRWSTWIVSAQEWSLLTVQRSGLWCYVDKSHT